MKILKEGSVGSSVASQQNCVLNIVWLYKKYLTGTVIYTGVGGSLSSCFREMP